MIKHTVEDSTFQDFDKCVHDITNNPIAKEQLSFRSYNHEIYTATSNKFAIHNPNENYKDLQDDDTITTYLLNSNTSFNLLIIKIHQIMIKEHPIMIKEEENDLYLKKM